MRRLFSPTPALGSSALFSAQSVTETLPTGYPQPLKMVFFVPGDLFPSLPSIPPEEKRAEAGKEAKPGVGGHCAGRVKGTHGSGQRSTWSLVSEGEMRFWLLRMMSAFWALLTSAL